MEVAVDFTPSLARYSRRIIAAAAIVLGSLSLGGCSTGFLDSPSAKARDEGIKLYNDNQYPEAAGAFTTVIKQQPQDYVAHYYLGRTYEAMKDYHLAIKCYRTSLSVMANSQQGQYDTEFRNKVLDGLASSVAAGNDIALEERAFTNGQSAQTAEDHYVLAKVRRLQKDPDSAIEEYQKAGSLDPKSIAIAKESGLYLMQLNQKTKAAQELRRAYVLNRKQYKEDEQVNEALRKLNVVPGPSLVEEADLATPIIPPQLVPDSEMPQPMPASSRSGGRVSAGNP
jgi:tetratricopeptide (TPR) repeat protein